MNNTYTISTDDYDNLLNGKIQFPDGPVFLGDHIGGFDSNLKNTILDYLDQKNFQNKFLIQYYVDDQLKKRYPQLDINMGVDLQNSINFNSFHNYTVHPEINFQNFLCSFNGTFHVGRQLLTSIIKKFGWYDPKYCSKNFSYQNQNIQGHVMHYLGDQEHRYYSKFFSNDDEFCQSVNSFGHIRFDHANNIYNLESKLTESFLHLVSETLATSYYPFVTEKFLYSVTTRGLFLAYAQPGWHTHLEKYYGFKLYNKIFDYSFDQIQNPIIRLVELLSMISKFSVLSKDDWNDLYLIEQDAIEYNYEHYFRKNFLDCLKQHVKHE